MIKLDKGGTYSEQALQDCYCALRDLVNDDVKAASELVSKVKDPDYAVSEQAASVLRTFGLIEPNAPVRPIVRDVVASTAIGSGTDMSFMHPSVCGRTVKAFSL